MVDLIDLTIDALSYGGRGVGRHDGKAVFVPEVLPGEQVRVRIVRDKKRYAEAELVTLLQAAPERRQPPCRFFPECGGCQWQHLPYPLQLAQKQQIFFETLQRSVELPADVVRPIVASPDEAGYRCRAQVKFHQGGKGLFSGFYRPGSHYVVDIDHCLVLDPALPPLIDRLRDCLDDFAQSDRVPQADLCVDSFGLVSLIVHFIGTDRKGLAERLQRAGFGDHVSLYLQSGRKATLQPLGEEGGQAISPELDGVLRLGFPAGGFVQINLEQNRRLVAEVVAAAIRTGQERILDLYSGIGNFSLPLARRCMAVVGVEEYAPGVDAAIDNARQNGLGNCRFIAGRTEDVIRRLVGVETFDVVVLDPPRSGAADAIGSILQLSPSRIVYVSCDPSTLARDLKPLLHNGYRLASARPLDMFPQTWHIEGIVVLEREGGSAA